MRKAAWLALLCAALAGRAGADPVAEWSTYLGRADIDSIRDVALDAAGDLLVAGDTRSAGLAFGAAPFQPALAGGRDAFVAKLDGASGALVWLTYFGGGGDDVARSVAVDASGHVTLAGDTTSDDLPLAGPWRRPRAGGSDGFVARLTPDGAGLVFSTQIGGGARDGVGAIAVAPDGEVAVLGETESSDLPVAGALQPAPGGGIDAFVARLDAGGALRWLGYLGGSLDDAPFEVPYAVALDAGGRVAACGTTESLDFPTAAALQPTHAGGLRDGTIAVFEADGAMLRFATYWGGARGDSIRACAFAPDGDLVFGGASRSYDRASPEALQTDNRGVYDAVVARIAADGASLRFSTLLGGAAADGIVDVAVDADGDVAVLGQTESAGFPLADPLQDARGGAIDAFVARLTPTASSLVFATFLGGSQPENPHDRGAGLALAPDGTLFAGGTTWSADFPTRTAAQPATGGGADGWVARIPAPPEADLSLASGAGGATRLALALANAGPAAVTVQWKAWAEVGGARVSLSSGTREIAAGARVEPVRDALLPASLPFPGTTIGARVLDPATGRVLSERVCRQAPCP